jgi:hypothetical protein
MLDIDQALADLGEIAGVSLLPEQQLMTGDHSG